MQQPRTWGRRAIALLAGVGLATGVVLSTATGAGAQSGSTPGVTAKDITLGYISSETGVAASASEGSANGCKARIGAENAKGGVNGRKIKLEAIDDQSANNLNNAKDLVQNRNAFIVINDSPFAVLELPVPERRRCADARWRLRRLLLLREGEREHHLRVRRRHSRGGHHVRQRRPT